MIWWGWMILIVANLPVFYAIRRLIFPTWEDFGEAVRFWLTPDLLSMFRGEWAEDQWNELKLLVWIALCAGCVWVEYLLLVKYVLP